MVCRRIAYISISISIVGRVGYSNELLALENATADLQVPVSPTLGTAKMYVVLTLIATHIFRMRPPLPVRLFLIIPVPPPRLFPSVIAAADSAADPNLTVVRDDFELCVEVAHTP